MKTIGIGIIGSGGIAQGAHLPGYTDNVSQIGTFALTSGPSGVSEVTTDTDNTGTVGWSFTLSDNDPVLQSLARATE